MVWNEADHPRDELGRFTFSSGTGEDDEKDYEPDENGIFNLSAEKNDFNNKTSTEVLLGDSIKLKERQKAIDKYKVKLLDILGKKATHADVLYATTRQLEKKIQENGLGERLRKLKNEAAPGNIYKKLMKKAADAYIKRQKPETLAKQVGKGYGPVKNAVSKKVFGQDAAGMLDISHNKVNDKTYLENTFEIKNYKDERFKKYQDYLKDKLSTQYKHYGFDINSIKGRYFSPNSIGSKNMANNVYLENFLKENKTKLLNNYKSEMSIDFKTGNMYYAHHFVDVIDYSFDDEGNLELVIADTNDYNEGEDSKLVQAGNIAMKNGDLEPLFSIKHIYIPKERLEELWRK